MAKAKALPGREAFMRRAASTINTGGHLQYDAVVRLVYDMHKTHYRIVFEEKGSSNRRGPEACGCNERSR